MKKTAYRQDYLMEHLIKDIEDGKYIGQPFPFIREIAREKGFSLNVTLAVVRKLIEQGYLKNIPGSYKLELAEKFQKPVSSLSEVIFLNPAPFQSPAKGLWSDEIQQVCTKHEIHFRNIPYNDQHDHQLLSSLRKGNKLIFMIPHGDPTPELLSKMRSCRTNLVTLWHDFTDQGISMVENTPFLGMELLLNHLKERGNKVIHCVNTLPNNRAVKPRILLWENFLEKSNLTGQLWDFSKSGKSSYETARSMIHQFIASDKGNLPDAFICTGSSSAIGLSRGLADLGLFPGKDVSLCAFSPSYDNNLEFFYPSITSIKSPSPATMVERVIEQFITGKFTPGKMIQPESLELFEGESTEGRRQMAEDGGRRSEGRGRRSEGRGRRSEGRWNLVGVHGFSVS